MRTPGPTRPSKLWVTIGPLTLLKKSWTKCFRIFAKFCDKHCILCFHKSDEKNEIYRSDKKFFANLYSCYTVTILAWWWPSVLIPCFFPVQNSEICHFLSFSIWSPPVLGWGGGGGSADTSHVMTERFVVLVQLHATHHLACFCWLVGHQAWPHLLNKF